MSSPFFAADKTCDNEFMVKSNHWICSVHDIFYSSRLFLDEDVLIKLDTLLWMFWKVMSLWGQHFHSEESWSSWWISLSLELLDWSLSVLSSSSLSISSLPVWSLNRLLMRVLALDLHSLLK